MSTPPTPTHAAALAELGSMKRIVATLEALDPAARARVLDWLVDRYASDGETPADREDVPR